MHICNKILFIHKNKEILPFETTWIELEGIMLIEISQTEKDRYCMVSLLCGILKNNTQNNDIMEKNVKG